MNGSNKKQIIISVIVTIHNAEKYLCECLDSVLTQTFSDIEILCMDGGSIDNSQIGRASCRQFSPNIKRICKEG